MFHYGHVRMLERARALGDTLVVGVVRDEDVQLYKRTPVLALEERMEVVRGCRHADEVVVAQLVVDQAFLNGHVEQEVIKAIDADIMLALPSAQRPEVTVKEVTAVSPGGAV